MKMFYNVVNSIICCAKEARASIVLKWVHFVLQNCENFKLHSVRGLYDKKQRLIVLCTSDVMYKKYKRLLYTLLDLLARFCKVNLSKAKFGRADWAGGGEKAEVPTESTGCWNGIFHSSCYDQCSFLLVTMVTNFSIFRGWGWLVNQDILRDAGKPREVT